MSDSITSCILHRNEGGMLQAYEFVFEFDGVDVPSPHNVVFIPGSSVSDPTDLNAVKAEAFIQARAIKAFYQNSEDVPSMVGPVVL
jgi:hypothetical protein